MTKKDILTVEELTGYLKQGMSTCAIAREINHMLDSKTIYDRIYKYNLQSYMNPKYKKHKPYKIEKIDTPQKAYMLGFIACDGYIDKKDSVEVALCRADREILVFMKKCIGDMIIHEDETSLNKKGKRFKRVRINRKIADIRTFIGGPLKKDRHLPIVRDEFNRYLLLGAFDADGCVSYGKRKDKDGIWQNIIFTSQYNLCVCIQNILLNKLNIATAIRPKRKGDCYIIKIAGKENVLKFLDYIYPDNSFVVLKRKYYKQKALRLELEENGGTTR